MGNVRGLYQTFEAVGNVILIDDSKVTEDYKKGYLETYGTNNKNYFYRKIKFGVKCSNGSTIFPEMMGGYDTKKPLAIKKRNKSNEEMVIEWNDRFNKSKLDEMGHLQKLHLNLLTNEAENTNVFLHEFDFIEALKNGLQKDMRVKVKGNIAINRYKNKQGEFKENLQFTIKDVYLAKEDDVDGVRCDVDFLYKEGALNDILYKEEGKILVECYGTKYDSEMKDNEVLQIPNVLIDKQTIVNGNKKLMSNPELTEKLIEMYKKYFECDKNEVKEMKWQGEIFIGRPQVEITFDDLDEDTKMYIEMGIMTLEEAIKQRSGSNFGDRTVELRLVKPKVFGSEELKQYVSVSEFPIQLLDGIEMNDESLDDLLNSGDEINIDDIF